MAVLLLLILVDLVVVGIIMWAVVREPHREPKGDHPFVVSAREAEQKAQAAATIPAPPAEPVVEAPKTEENA